MIKNAALLAGFVFFLGACSEQEKPQYNLADSTLRFFEGGDQLTYTVLQTATNNESLSEYSLKLESSDLFDANNNTLDTFKEIHTGSGNFNPPFISRYFSQNEEGDWIIQAINSEGNVLWLLDENNEPAGQTYYLNNLANTPESYSFDKNLFICDNTNCENSGNITFSYDLVGTENISTPYADFEAYEFDISLTINITANSISSTSRLYVLDGREWIYPPLGVVKHDYDVLDEAQSYNLIGHLSQTNISISSELKN